MALARPTSKISGAKLKGLKAQIEKQEISTSAPKTSDPSRPFFDRFRVKAGERDIVYIPNHTVEINGDQELRMDIPLLHTVHPDQNTWSKVRCVRGIVSEEAGLDGTCPLCEAASTGFEYAKAVLAAKFQGSGVNVEDRTDPTVKSARSEIYRDRPIHTAEEYRTFPICILQEERNAEGKLVPVLDENGHFVFETQYYTVSERGWVKNWATIFDDMDEDEDIPETIAGRFFTLRYGSMDADGKRPSPRDAAKDLQIKPRKTPTKNGVPVDVSYMDKFTEDWDEDNMREVIFENQVYSVEDLRKLIEPIEARMRATIDMLASGSNAGAVNSGPSLDALTGGQASGTAQQSAGLIDAGSVDEDDSESFGLDD